MNGNEKITDAFADIDTKYIQATITAPQKSRLSGANGEWWRLALC